MDQNKLRQFISQALMSGHGEESIVNFIKSNMKSNLASSASSNNAPVGSNVTPNQNFVSLVAKYFPQDQVQNALKVIQGESGGNPQAVGDNYPIKGEIRPSYGLFQIRTFPNRPSPEQLMDPEQNVAYAAQLYKNQGWKPWTAARKLGLVN